MDPISQSQDAQQPLVTTQPSDSLRPASNQLQNQVPNVTSTSASAIPLGTTPSHETTDQPSANAGAAYSKNTINLQTKSKKHLFRWALISLIPIVLIASGLIVGLYDGLRSKLFGQKLVSYTYPKYLSPHSASVLFYPNSTIIPDPLPDGAANGTKILESPVISNAKSIILKMQAVPTNAQTQQITKENSTCNKTNQMTGFKENIPALGVTPTFCALLQTYNGQNVTVIYSSFFDSKSTNSSFVVFVEQNYNVDASGKQLVGPFIDLQNYQNTIKKIVSSIQFK